MLMTPVVLMWLTLAAQDRQLLAPVLEISARVVGADGGASGMAGESGAGALDRYVWVDGNCRPASGDQPPGGSVSGGWHVAASVLNTAGDMLTAQFNWQSLSDRGRIAEGSRQSSQRILRPGDRVELARIVVSACPSTVIVLEASAIRQLGAGRGGRASAAGAGRGGGGGRGTVAEPTARGGIAAGGGARGGRGSGGGTGSTEPTSAAARGSGGGGRGGVASATGRGGRGAANPDWTVAAGASTGTGEAAAAGRGGSATAWTVTGGRGYFNLSNAYEAELWLVHTLPEGKAREVRVLPPKPGTAVAGRGGSPTQERTSFTRALPLPRSTVNRQVVRFQPGGAGFVFPVVTLSTSQGPITVIVTGSLSVRMAGDAPAALVVTINRQTAGNEAAAAASGSTTKEIPWDQAREVVSFELPAATGGGSGPVEGHSFSLRVRVTRTPRG